MHWALVGYHSKKNTRKVDRVLKEQKGVFALSRILGKSIESSQNYSLQDDHKTSCAIKVIHEIKDI